MTASRADGPVPNRAESTGFAPGSARSLLQTVLGELVWPNGEPAWTSALVHVMAGLGIEEQTARQAIARAASSDWIVAQRHGREVAWSLTPTLTSIFESGAPRVYSLSNPYPDWDGTWLTLYVTIPHSHRGARRRLYSGLTWAGLGNPAPGLWLSPHTERVAEVRHVVDELDLHDHTFAFLGAVDAATGIGGSDIVARGWDLEALAEHYRQVDRAVLRRTPAAGDATLYAHLRMVSEWQRFPFTDPQLPEALLPDWIGRRVARRIEDLRAQWAPAVRQRWSELNAADAS